MTTRLNIADPRDWNPGASVDAAHAALDGEGLGCHVFENCTILDAPLVLDDQPQEKTIGEITLKDSNPKDSIGITKAPLSTVSMPVMLELGVAMLEGAIKYGRHNYRKVGVKASVYFDATVGRHLAAWWEGEDIDEESGMSHLTKAMASLMVLRDANIRGAMIDDRPPTTFGFVQALNIKTKELLDRAKRNNIEHKRPYTIAETDEAFANYLG